MVLSKDLSLFVNNLQGNWGFIENFLNDPKSLLEKFKLSTDEEQALLSRNTSELVKLGVGDHLAMAARSGAHSQTCSSNCTTDWKKSM